MWILKKHKKILSLLKLIRSYLFNFPLQPMCKVKIWETATEQNWISIEQFLSLFFFIWKSAELPTWDALWDKKGLQNQKRTLHFCVAWISWGPSPSVDLFWFMRTVGSRESQAIVVLCNSLSFTVTPSWCCMLTRKSWRYYVFLSSLRYLGKG